MLKLAIPKNGSFDVRSPTGEILTVHVNRIGSEKVELLFHGPEVMQVVRKDAKNKESKRPQMMRI